MVGKEMSTIDLDRSLVNSEPKKWHTPKSEERPRRQAAEAIVDVRRNRMC